MSYQIDDEVRIAGPRNVGRDGYPDGYDIGVKGRVVKGPVNLMYQIEAEGLRPYWIAAEHLEPTVAVAPVEPEAEPAAVEASTPEGN